MARFNVTYDIVSEESAEAGYIGEGLRLRDAVQQVLETRTSRCDSGEGVEASDSDIGQARWISVYNGMEYETGCYETRAIHLPDSVTAASRGRILRLIQYRH